MTTIIDGSASATFATPLPALQGGTGVSSAPAFSAYSTANQSIASSTYTKVVLNAKEFDTNNSFDAATNSRFQPTVAGYYQVGFSINTNGSTSMTRIFIALYKNGIEFKRSDDLFSVVNVISGSALVFMNGSTDYLELFAYIVASTPTVFAGTGFTYLQAFLARAA